MDLYLLKFKKEWGGRRIGQLEEHDAGVTKYLEFNDIAERVDESKEEQKPNKSFKNIKKVR